MDKDYDYNEFMAFMQHLGSYHSLIALEQRSRVFKELEMLDYLEAEVLVNPDFADVASLLDYARNL